MNKRLCLLLALALLALLATPSWETRAGLADSGANHRIRNLHFGVSGGNVRDITRRFCCSGTLGSLVQDSNGVQYILSNNHVLGLSGRANAGDDVSQPGLIDSNCQVSTVVADFTVAPALNSNVDAAIAQLRPGQMDSTGFIEDIGTISSVVKTPAVGLAVAKSGRTTGSTTGSISSINTTVSVRYPKSCGSGGGTLFTFTNQVVVTPGSFSAGGDSGSLIVTNDSNKQPVALLFAGSSSATIGNPVGLVLTRLSTSLGRTVSFVGAPVGSPSAESFPPGPDILVVPERQDVERATAAKNRHERSLMANPAVLGVGVGALDGNEVGAAIVIYVERGAGRMILPRALDGVRVRVIETDPFIAY